LLLDLSNLEKLHVVFRISSMYKFILRAGSNLTTFGRLKNGQTFQKCRTSKTFIVLELGVFHPSEGHITLYIASDINVVIISKTFRHGLY
jgi:hypothetical protein